MKLSLFLLFSFCISVFAGQYHYSEWDWQEKMAGEGWEEFSDAVREEMASFQEHPYEEDIYVILCNRSNKEVSGWSISFADTSFDIPVSVNPRSLYVFRHAVSLGKSVGDPVWKVSVQTENGKFTNHLVDPNAVREPMHYLFLDILSDQTHFSKNEHVGALRLIDHDFPISVEYGKNEPSISAIEHSNEQSFQELSNMGDLLSPDVRTMIEKTDPNDAVIQATIMIRDGNLGKAEQRALLYSLYCAAKKKDKRNNYKALYHLGCCFFSGYGCSQNFQTAYACFSEAAKIGACEGPELMLGYCFEKGIVVPRNLTKSKAHYWLSMKDNALGIANLRLAYLCFATEPRDRLFALDILLATLRHQWPAEPILEGLQKQFPNGIPFDD